MKNSILYYSLAIAFCGLFLSSATISAQKNKAKKDILYLIDESRTVYVVKHNEIDLNKIDSKDKIFVYVDEEPKFGGQPEQVKEFFKENLRYPKIEQEDTLKSRIVHLQYCVTKDGGIEDVSVIKGLTPELDAEAIRLFKSIPTMKPGKKNGMPVSTITTYRVSFDSINSPLIAPSRDITFKGKSENPERDTAIDAYFKPNLYPAALKEQGLQGKVTVCFYINPEGKIQDISLINRTNSELDNIILRKVEFMSGWKPRTIEGKPVYTRIEKSFIFRF